MKAKKKMAENKIKESTKPVRATISFPPNVYTTLEDIAKEKKVSLAWVVREAVDGYLDEKWPLFKGDTKA
jgi:hypothetical protein